MRWERRSWRCDPACFRNPLNATTQEPQSHNAGGAEGGQKLRFGTFGRFDETPVAEMSPEMRDAYDFSRQLRGLVPSPHKIWLANPKLSKTIVPTGVYFQTQSTLTKAEIEIVTNPVNAHWLAAYGTYEHEKIGEEQGHPPPSARGARSGSRGGGRKVLDP